MGGYGLCQALLPVFRVIPIPIHNVPDEIDGFFRLARAVPVWAQPNASSDGIAAVKAASARLSFHYG